MNELERILKDAGKNVVSIDLAREDFSEAVSLAFKYSKLVIASSTYNMGIFPPMQNFLNRLKGLSYQNRTVAIIENGTWAPNSGKCMKDCITDLKDIKLIEPIITIKSSINEKNVDEFKKLTTLL